MWAVYHGQSMTKFYNFKMKSKLTCVKTANIFAH